MTHSRLGTAALASACLLADPVAMAQVQQAQQTPQAQPAPGPAAAGGVAMSASFAGQPVAANATLTLSFAAPFAYANGRWAVMVGSEDVTVHFQLRGPTELQGAFDNAALPAGDTLLRLFGLGAGGQWQLLAQAPLQVLSPDGQRRAQLKPSTVVGAKGQVWERHSASTLPVPRANHVDATLQLGVQAELADSDWGLKSSANVVGASYQPEALRYAQRGNQAPRTDLAQYLVEATRRGSVLGPTTVALGQVQAGSHPLLANNIANRGLMLRQALGERSDLLLSAQSSSPLQGFDNPLGVADSGRRLSLLTLGHELLPRAGGLRAELSYFDGRARAAANAPASTTPERSRGWGLRLQGASEDRRWRVDLALSHSDSSPLAAGNSSTTPSTTPSTPVAAAPSAANKATVVDLAHDLVQGHMLWPGLPDYPLSLTVGLRHERVTPGYRSLGAFLNTDYQANTLALNAGLGPLAAAIKLTTHEDNLAHDTSRTRNRAPVLSLGISAPLAQMVDAQAPSRWWPTLQVDHSRHHDHANPAHVPVNQTAADLPDTRASTHRLGLSWALPTGSVGYAMGRTTQERRQPVTAREESRDTTHEFNASWAAGATLALNGSLGWHRTEALLTAEQTRSLSLNGGARWAVAERTTLTLQWASGLVRDQPTTALRRNTLGELMLSRSFELPLEGLKLPGQWSLRYAGSTTSLHGSRLPDGPTVRYQSLQASTSLVF
jgi:hypothetical protein